MEIESEKKEKAPESGGIDEIVLKLKETGACPQKIVEALEAMAYEGSVSESELEKAKKELLGEGAVEQGEAEKLFGMKFIA